MQCFLFVPIWLFPWNAVIRWVRADNTRQDTDNASSWSSVPSKYNLQGQPFFEVIRHFWKPRCLPICAAQWLIPKSRSPELFLQTPYTSEHFNSPSFPLGSLSLCFHFLLPAALEKLRVNPAPVKAKAQGWCRGQQRISVLSAGVPQFSPQILGVLSSLSASPH